MSDQQHEVDFQHSKVIKEASYIGYTRYVNIRTGQTTDVPWGSGDWLGFFAICAFGLFLFLLFGGMAAVVWPDASRHF